MIIYQRRRYQNGRAQLVANKEEQSCTRPLEAVEVGDEALKLIKIEKEQHLCWKASYRREENLGDELIEIGEEEFYHKKTERHINGDGGDLVFRKCAYVHIDDEQLQLSLAVARPVLAPLVERGISCPFVSSKKFHKRMVEDECMEGREPGPRATDEFREDVLRVLRKPFDKAEYRRYREEIRAGSYPDHHPEKLLDKTCEQFVLSMALVPDHYCKNRHLVPDHAVNDLRRARARVRSKPDDTIRHVMDSGTTDEVYKHMLLSLLTVDDGAVSREQKLRKSVVDEHRVRPVVERKRKRNESSLDRQDGGGTGRDSEKNKLLCVKKEPGVIKNTVKKEKQCENGASSKKVLDSLGNDHLHDEDNKANVTLIHSQGDFVAQARPVKTYGKQVGGKLKGVVKEGCSAYTMVKKENEANDVVKKEKEVNQDCRSRNCVTRNHCKDVGQVQLGKKDAVRGGRGLIEENQGDNGLASKKIAFGNSAVKKEPEDCVNTRQPIEGIHSGTRNGKCAEYSTEHKNSNEKYLEGRVRSNSVPEVEILDNDMVIKAGIFSPFIPSTKFHSSVYDKKSKDLGLPSAENKFRTELLKILRKPYDKEEHQKLRETIKPPYLKGDRGLQKKLRKCRYKREKRLVLLRGLSFWLQNVTREGAFKPWKDEECLAVEIS